MDITNEINIINTYERGEDVRDAFTDACEIIVSGLLPDAETEGYFLMVNSLGEWEAMPWT